MIRKHLCGKYRHEKINKLLPHEKINPAHVKKVKELIQKEEFFNNPIIIDKKTKLIIDGHHRYHSALEFGIKFVPVFEINYNQPRIKVFKKNIKGIQFSKHFVLQKAKKSELLDCKATCHAFVSRKKILMTVEEAIPRSKPIPLSRLL